MKSPYLEDRILVRLLAKLSFSERKGLSHYLECPLFNKNTVLVQALEILEKKVLNSNNSLVTAEDFLEGSGIPPNRLNKIFSALYQATNDFLELQERRRSPNEKYRYLFQAYDRFEIDSTIQEKEFRKALKQIKAPPGSAENFHLEFWLNHEIGTRIADKARNKNESGLDHNERLLDGYYLLNKLKYMCATHNLSWVYKREREDHFDQDVVSICEKQARYFPPVTQAYWLVLQAFLYNDQKDGHLARLHLLFEQSQDAISRGDLLDLYGYALNLCTPAVEAGETKAVDLVDRMYMRLLDHGLLLVRGRISPFHFKNIAILRIRKNKMDWVRGFIDEFGARLSNDFDGLIVKHVEGLLHFYSGRIREAILAFKAVIADGTQDVFVSLDARNMLWRSYFANYHALSAEEFEEMQKLYDSFRLYVSRNEHISSYYKEINQNFIWVLNRLLTALEKDDLSPKLLVQLESEAESVGHVTNKQWLLGAIRQFK